MKNKAQQNKGFGVHFYNDVCTKEINLIIRSVSLKRHYGRLAITWLKTHAGTMLYPDCQRVHEEQKDEVLDLKKF